MLERKKSISLYVMVQFFEQISLRVAEVAAIAARYIATQREDFSPSAIEHKGVQNLVSYVDKEAERLIYSELSDIVPGAKFLGEESADGSIVENPEGEYLWVIDPLDGTANFIHSMPPYCVSIALMYGGQVVVGVIYEVTRSECFRAYRGGPCYLNDREIRVSDIQSVSDSLVITGVSYDERSSDSFERAFSYFNRNTNGTRRIGSAAANLAYVAAGRAECFFQRGLSPWDVAAGALLVECAGGVVTDYSGGNNYIFGREIITTNKNSYNNFYNIICNDQF